VIYILLSMTAFSASSVFYKMASNRGCRSLGLNFALFLAATLILSLYLVLTGFQFHSTSFVIGAFGGVSVLITSVCFFLAVHHGGKLSVCWTVLSLSFIIPALASIIVWGEDLSAKRIVGLVLVTISLFLLGGKTE
jgi:uncharacterized membrane protein